MATCRARRGALLVAARQARSDLAGLRVERYPSQPFHERIRHLRANVTVYDASYVALAAALGRALLTGDRRLAGAPGPESPIQVLES